MAIDDAITRALRNIAKHGDTDIFPFPFERHVFFDKEAECRSLLLEIHSDFETWLNSHPPATHESLTQVGYTGFRWASQIEPFWNAYYLALVISLADQIEASRIPDSDGVVFSYRYEWSDQESKLFKQSTWMDYRRRSMDLAQKSKFVVLTDIADFYPRIYHHRLENSLKRLPSPGDIPKRIMDLLSKFAKNVSYGLPIGGPASRILAELALNGVDKLLTSHRISFCRYADDYCIFCETKSDAYRALVFLSQKLFNEGLGLQKKKTKILTAAEHLETGKLLDPKDSHPPASDEDKLLNITIRFDPYSATPEEDYDSLKAAVAEVDVLGILGREIAKTGIDTVLTKQAIDAVRALDTAERFGAIRTLLDRHNLDVLSPVFVTIMRLVRSVYDDLKSQLQDEVDQLLISVFDDQQHSLSVDLNLSYFIQTLAKRHSPRKEEIMTEVYETNASPVIRRIIISAMANWQCHHWVSDIKQRYGGLNEWERRSIILASYTLGDEGRHWREDTRPSWNKFELLIRDWYSHRVQAKKLIPI